MSDRYFAALDKYQQALEADRTARNALAQLQQLVADTGRELEGARDELLDQFNNRGNE
ncbi:MAG: hypothetical protein ACXVHJ_05350 [Solirubrobacteraceae bacterium]